MSDERPIEDSGQIVGNKNRLGRRLGSGSFGDIYLGTSLISGVEYALKLESETSSIPQLRFEQRLYKSLQDSEGIPQYRWFGTESLRRGRYNVLAMELLGLSRARGLRDGRVCAWLHGWRRDFRVVLPPRRHRVVALGHHRVRG